MSRSRRGGPISVRAGPPQIVRAVLDNGVAVVLCPSAHLAQTYVAVYFGVGSRHETADNNGVTHSLEHMLFRGTDSHRDATELNSAAEAFGGFLEGATYRDHLYFATGCHPSAVGSAIAILGELVASPRYQGLEIERAILREELLETVDQYGRMIDLDNIAHRAVFGSQGLGLPIEGTLDNLEAVTLEQLEAHRDEFLVGDNAVVSIAGPIDPDRALTQIRRAFGGLRSGTAPLVGTPALPTADPVMRYVRDASSQVEIRISFRAVPIQHPGFPPLVMLGRLLGDGLASRMNADLVDRRGLAYSLHAGLTRYADCALFDFEISVAPDRAAEAVAAILDFARSSSRFRYTADEMRRVRRRYKYSMEFRSDSVADLAAWHGCATLFGIDDQLDTLGRRINRIDGGAIRAAARDLFRREGLVIAAAGQLARGEWSRVRRVVERWRV